MPSSILGGDPKLTLPKESSRPATQTLPKGASFGTSRGPSPLTLGMSDVVPLAVAFQVRFRVYHNSPNIANWIALMSTGFYSKLRISRLVPQFLIG